MSKPASALRRCAALALLLAAAMVQAAGADPLFGVTLTGIDDARAMDLYRKCIRLYADDESNTRFAEQYKRALIAVNGSR